MQVKYGEKMQAEILGKTQVICHPHKTDNAGLGQEKGRIPWRISTIHSEHFELFSLPYG